MDFATSRVFELAQAGQVFDQILINRLADSQNEINGVVSNLNRVGLTSLAAQLQNYDPLRKLISLKDYLLAQQSSFLSKMGIFRSFSQLVPEVTASDAFGSVFSGRTFVASVDTVNASVDDYAATADGSLTTDGLTHAEVLAGMNYRVNQLLAAPTQATTSMDGEAAFFENATSVLNNFVLAQQIVSSFSDFSLKPVIGAIGSSAVVDVLNVNSLTNNPPPVIPDPTGPDPVP